MKFHQDDEHLGSLFHLADESIEMRHDDLSRSYFRVFHRRTADGEVLHDVIHDPIDERLFAGEVVMQS